MEFIYNKYLPKFSADGKYTPDFSLNEYIRTVAKLRGTKAMCYEGGCGVCVVNVRIATPPMNEFKSYAVNSVRKVFCCFMLYSRCSRVGRILESVRIS